MISKNHSVDTENSACLLGNEKCMTGSLYPVATATLYNSHLIVNIRPSSPQHKRTMSLRHQTVKTSPLQKWASWPGCSELVNTEILIVALGIIVSILLLVTTHSVLVSSRGNELYVVYKFICK